MEKHSQVDDGAVGDEELREEDVTRADNLDDKVEEGDGLPEAEGKDDPPASE